MQAIRASRSRSSARPVFSSTGFEIEPTRKCGLELIGSPGVYAPRLRSVRHTPAGIHDGHEAKMATRQARLDAFPSDAERPDGQVFEILCEDHVGTYMLPFLCRWRDDDWWS